MKPHQILGFFRVSVPQGPKQFPVFLYGLIEAFRQVQRLEAIQQYFLPEAFMIRFGVRLPAKT
ncbi:MAG: hypothetical protein PVI06_11640 [Desulfobacterales bacterium]|jgi:hypothetical protein